ncbi:hypothetical protein, partial [Mycobacterium ulcerans]|uniref:hypothetical protein n=1 Tax=Mycobacterium ulcerans TaxID=1809 RepID=UPI00111B142C
RSVWKWLGLAGVAGVVAGGALVVRDQRKRRSYSADEVRARLHPRLDEAGTPGDQAGWPMGPDGGWVGPEGPDLGIGSEL